MPLSREKSAYLLPGEGFCFPRAMYRFYNPLSRLIACVSGMDESLEGLESA